MLKEQELTGAIKWIAGLLVALVTTIGGYLISENRDMKLENKALNIQMIATQKEYIETINRNTQAFNEFKEMLERIGDKK